jgi:predicted NACHT family NTPase
MVKKRLLVKATPQGIEKAEKALMRLGLGTKTNFANTRRLSRTTVTKFFNREPIQLDSLQRICEELTLPWREIIDLSENAELELGREEQNASSSQSSIPDINALVQEMREKIKPDIQERCGTMRVLDMNQPIALGDIYTSVNILEKITGRRGFKHTELMRDASLETFERFSLGDIRERRIPGLEAVEKFSKLMILGKPGAGKTTFLKHLAVGCIGGGFLGDRLPVFITLKEFAETDGKPDLLAFIEQLVAMPYDPSPTPPRSGEGLSYSPFHTREGGWGVRSSMQSILSQGQALILLDGLDEVKEIDNSRILRQIKEFSLNYPLNQFIITCRIAAKEYTFEKFTEVEIADFNDEQIADFSGKWFLSKNDPIKAERFLQRLNEDAPIRELAASPLLLTLLCLVFEDIGSFPTNRAELYQTGVDVLLKKWDVKRNIEREQVYKRLSLKRKEDLLSQIARTTFEAGNYFFKQREVERYITQYIQNLPEASTDPEVLELDSVAVLKSIEAQHGLFVERARGIYSFSHLTFHEYFTARKIVTSCNPYAADDPTLQMLVSHVTEKRWREVFLLTVGMVDSAEVLLKLMKVQVDDLLAGDEKLQEFLRWVDEKARSVEVLYKPVAVRLFYFSEACRLPSTILMVFRHASSFEDAILFYNKDYRDFLLALDSTVSFYNEKLNTSSKNLLNACQREKKEIVPEFSEKKNKETFTRPKWIPSLTHSLTHSDWKFSDEQKQLLQQYYDANKLLIDCLNSDCYVSREVRQEIEETLLLPIAQIKQG